MRGQPGHNKRPYARFLPSLLDMDAWMTLHLNVALIRKLHVLSLMCLDYFLDILAWLFIRPGIGRRPVNWCS